MTDRLTSAASFRAMILDALAGVPLPENDDTLAGLRSMWCTDGAARDLRELGDIETAEQLEFVAENMRALLERACVDFVAAKGSTRHGR